jgi:hypothetical protein
MPAPTRQTVVNKMVIDTTAEGRYYAIHIWRKRKVTLMGPNFAGFDTYEAAEAAANANGFWACPCEG